MSAATDVFGSRVDVPEYFRIDPADSQKQTIEGNLAASTNAGKLASSINTMSQDSLKAMWNTVLPQYNKMLDSVSNNLLQQISGNIPNDVVESIGRAADARALAGGYGVGSGMKRNLTARDLGLTSLDISQRAISSTMNWLQTLKGTSVAQQMNPASMMLTPEQRYQQANEQNQFGWNVAMRRAQEMAAPDPATRGIMQMATSFGGMLGGGALGGGLTGGGSGGGGGGIMSMIFPGLMCWVAREVYGESNPKWLIFRKWLCMYAPKWLFALYAAYGERFAAWIADKPRLKRVIRAWMERKVQWMEKAGEA